MNFLDQTPKAQEIKAKTKGISSSLRASAQKNNMKSTSKEKPQGENTYKSYI